MPEAKKASGAKSAASVIALIQFIWIAVSGGFSDAYESDLMSHVQLFGTICVAAIGAYVAYRRGERDTRHQLAETTS